MTQNTKPTRKPEKTAEDTRGPRPKPIKRQRGLPSGRAVVGGFLVALAATGVFIAYTQAVADPDTEYLVATADLEFGHQLTESDIELVPLDLPADQAARSFNAPEVLVGASLSAPLHEGELIQESGVTAVAGAGLVEVSFPIDTDRALMGAMAVNERLDIMATYGSGADAYTVPLVNGAILLGDSVAEEGAELTGSERALRVGLASQAQALAVTHAVNAGSISVARTTALDDDAEELDVYEPDRGDLPAPGTVELDEFGRIYTAPGLAQPEGDEPVDNPDDGQANGGSPSPSPSPTATATPSPSPSPDEG